VRGEERIKVTPNGTIVADQETGETEMPGVFAAGDIVTSDAKVISAIGGKRAAKAIHEYLSRKG